MMRSSVAALLLISATAFAASTVTVNAGEGRQPIPTDLYPGVLGDEAHQAELLEAHGIALPVGDVARVALLGVLGREGFVDDWPTTPEQAIALRLFSNYDGAGGRFGDTSIPATTGPGSLLAFAAYDLDARVTVVLVNQSLTATEEATVGLQGMGQKGAWRAFELGADGVVTSVDQGMTYDALLRHAVRPGTALLLEYAPVGGILPLPPEPLTEYSPAIHETALPAAPEPARGCSTMPGGLAIFALLAFVFRRR